MATVTPDDVLEFKDATEGFLCPLEANTYGLAFLSFEMKDYETKELIFRIGEESELPDLDIDSDTADPDALRRIRYDFSMDVLRKETISTTLVFSNGPRPMPDFRMIERHYFRDKLIKSFDFDFGFVIPNSTNTWESVYTMPPMDEGLINEIVANPYEVKSDSFYFCNGELIMHNKAQYRYFAAAGKASASIPPPVAARAPSAATAAAAPSASGGKEAEGDGAGAAATASSADRVSLGSTGGKPGEGISFTRRRRPRAPSSEGKRSESKLADEGGSEGKRAERSASKFADSDDEE